MSATSKIEWTDATWNPTRGCSRVSTGCERCYAERMAARFSGTGQPYEGLAVMKSDGPHGTGEVRFIEEALNLPLRWRKPKRIFVNSMSDLFHEKVPDAWIDRIFFVMEAASQHTFQVLTKRPERMHVYANDPDTPRRIRELIIASLGRAGAPLSPGSRKMISEHWPLENVWLGVSAEDQKTAGERIPLLLRTPAAVRWISAEPLLAPIDLNAITFGRVYMDGGWQPARYNLLKPVTMFFDEGDVHLPGLDWVVVGGESSQGARPMHPDWARSVREQCQAAGVPFFMKQICERGRKIPYEHFPEDLQVREYPKQC
jgi:protein gp37